MKKPGFKVFLKYCVFKVLYFLKGLRYFKRY